MSDAIDDGKNVSPEVQNLVTENFETLLYKEGKQDDKQLDLHLELHRLFEGVAMSLIDPQEACTRAMGVVKAAQIQLVSDPNTPALVAARKQGYEAGLRQGHTDCKNQGERTDLIATDSSQDTVTPSRPVQHKKQELERGK